MTIQLKTITKSAFLAAAIALGGLTGMAATSGTAEARSGINIELGVPGLHIGISDRGHYRKHRPHYRFQRCTPRRALNKARRMGIRHARIVRVNGRGVVVKGRKAYRGPVIASFAKHLSCPVRFVRPAYR